MANRFSQNFTLADIFNNKRLKDKLPLINYKERELENGKISRTTNTKSVNRLVFETAISAARPFYKPINTTRGGGVLIISGELVGDHNGAVDAVYNAILSKKTLLNFTANNADMIRYALKEAENTKRTLGITPKLYLRVQSMQQIEGMNNKELNALVNNIMENIFYGDNFPKTQKKFKVAEMLNFEANMKGDYASTYNQKRLKWKFRVGDV